MKETMSEYISLCIVCGTPLKSKRVNGTVVFFCPYCERTKEHLSMVRAITDEEWDKNIRKTHSEN